MAAITTIGAFLSPVEARSPAEIQTGDVTRFYAVHDAANGALAGDMLQRDYIDTGSDGVRQFIPSRIISGNALATEIAKDRAACPSDRAILAIGSATGLPRLLRQGDGQAHRTTSAAGPQGYPQAILAESNWRPGEDH